MISSSAATPLFRTQGQTRLGEVRSSVGEGVADAARQTLHRGDRSQADQHDEQSVFYEVLTFLFVPKPFHQVHKVILFGG